MKLSGEALMSLCVMLVGAGVVITAMKWPLKAALFPIIIGIPLFFMTMAKLFLTLFGKEEDRGKKSAMDFQFADHIDQATALRRTLITFAWVIGFSLLILFFGFPIAIPMFLLLYLKLRAKERWATSIILTSLTWGFFLGLFVWLLNTRFQEGWVVRWVRASWGG